MQVVDNSGFEDPHVMDTIDGSILIVNQEEIADSALRVQIHEKPALPPKPDNLSPLPRSISVSSAKEEL